MHKPKKEVVYEKFYSFVWKDNQGNKWSSFGTVFDMESVKLHGGKIIGKPRLVELE